jgi:hypothetical protein
MVWQLAPQQAQFPWPIADNSVFMFPAWQVLFVTAMVMGYHHRRLERYLTGVSERLRLGICGLLAVAVVGVYVTSLEASLTAHGMLVEAFFAKVHLRLGRLLVFVVFFSFAFTLLTLAWAPIRRALGWLLLPLGQDALGAYILHLFVVALAIKVRPLIFGSTPASPTDNTLLQMAGVVCIWTAIRLRPMALTWLHAWLARGAVLLAAARAYLYLPSHPSRDV